MRDDIIFGKNPVMEALKAGREINKILIATGTRDNIFKIARERGIPVSNIDRRKLDKVAGTQNHQGLVAFISPYSYYELTDILEEAKSKEEEPLIVILDGLSDENNLANIIRSAEAFGAHGIVIPKRNSVSLNSIVAKRSAGAIEYVKICRATNLSRTIEELKENGVWIYCAEADAPEGIQSVSFKGPVAVVIGSEGYGVGKLIKDKCDFFISIPIKGRVRSLNAANAAAIILFEICRQKSSQERS